jgi:ribosomal protein L2
MSNNYLKKSILKIKIKGFKNSSGKNHHGKTTVFHKGGGHKKKN